MWKTGLPVRSAVLKPHAGRLVVGWVTTSESLLLYVFLFAFVFLLHFTRSPVSLNSFISFLASMPSFFLPPVGLKLGDGKYRDPLPIKENLLPHWDVPHIGRPGGGTSAICAANCVQVLIQA